MFKSVPTLTTAIAAGGAILATIVASRALVSVKAGQKKQESKDYIVEEEEDYVKLSYDPLESHDLNEMTVHESCGAIATFVGTTRNSFQGKSVVDLEYYAYTKLALKQLQLICKGMRKKWDVKRVVILHRLGTCPVREASVMIAASSPHRKDALEAVHWAIDELKKTVPIWKKERYEDGSSWKQNASYVPQDLYNGAGKESKD